MSMDVSLKNKFEQDGFFPLHDVLTPLEVTALRQRMADIGNEVVTFPQEYVQLEPGVESGDVAPDPVRFNNVRKIWNLTRFDPVFQAYARHPKILSVVTGLLGPNVKIFADQTLCKPPKIGSAKPPHQDSAYWTAIDPPNLVVCWMALDDVGEHNGCMRFVPGSHQHGVIEHKHLEDFRVEDKNFDYDDEVSVALNAGSCSFHHSLVLHRTEANTSPLHRIGLTVAYMSADSNYIGDDEQPDYPLVAGEAIEGCV